MKNLVTVIQILFIILVSAPIAGAQNVGVATNSPDAPFHVSSSGQVLTPGGLMLLGDRSELHLELDFNRIQSFSTALANPTSLHLQPDGGNIGIGTSSPTSHLHVSGITDQFLTLHKTLIGGGEVGIDLLRGTEFNSTDWRIVNDGGTLQFLDAIDNFIGPPDLNMTISSSGDVGIGVKVPFSRLHVAGTSDQFVTVHRTTGGTGSGQSGIDLLRSTEFGGTDWRIVNDGGNLKFRDAINNFTGASDLNMTINLGGNVGIGTEFPFSRLHVAGTTDQFVTVHRTTGGSGQSGIDFLRDNELGGIDWRIVNDDGNLQFLDASNNFTGAADLNMTIDQGGNVGIGIESPDSKLHVNGTGNISENGEGLFQLGNPTGQHLRFDNNEILARNDDSPSMLYFQFWSGDLSLCSDDLGRVGIGTNNPVAKVQITDGDDVTLASGGELVLGSSTDINIAMDGNEIQARNSGSASPLYIQAGGGDLMLIPNENGQVGIGVSTVVNLPDDNDYLLAVDGKIISEEVRVEMSGSWPDYVFKNDYKLTPLNILESEIKKIGHLPGIPSAEEIEENGFELGDMQKKVLEKVEELTLYVIELKKEIEALKKDRN